MITCDLIGRMGNQMFQIATTAAHAWRVGKPYAFPDRAQGSYTGETYFHHLPKVNTRRVFPIYKERSHRYKPIPAGFTDVKLHGYWQSEKYFKEYRDQVTELFSIVPVDAGLTCSVHLRLGDYFEFRDKHPPVSVDYISNAIDWFIAKTNVRKFLVFSDQVALARTMLNDYIQSYVTPLDISFCEEERPLKALATMSGCAHNIIANSSFSWWGAWLNPNPDKIVIAPKIWFGPGNSHLDPTDIYCENWIKI